jgi:hypothetical protein
MATIEGDIRAVIDSCEWVAIATAGPDGPHLAATWGDYVRALGVDGDQILIPAGQLKKTEVNVASDARVELLCASRQVTGGHGAGQGCLLRGRARFRDSGAEMDRVRSRFPWARGVLVIEVETATLQL